MGVTNATLNELDQLGDWGLLATDAELVVTHWNRWLELRSGLDGAEVIGRPLFHVFPDMVARRLDRYYHQVLLGQTVVLSQRFHKYVIPIPLATDVAGHSHQQQTSRIIPIVDGQTVCGTLTLVEDVTERVAYEAELGMRARQQTAVASLARMALGGSAIDDLAREVVERVRDTLDVDFVEVLELATNGQFWERVAGRGWSEAGNIRFEASPGSRMWHVQASKKAGTVVDISPQLVTTDLGLHAHAIADGLIAPVVLGERLFGLLGFYTRYRRTFSPGEFLVAQALADVLGVAAERNRLEGELRSRIQELAEQDRRKDEFLAMLAHELRNPLAPVRNALQTLRIMFAANPDVERLTEMMSRQVGQIVRLVDDLLDVSRITRGKVTLRMQRIDLATVVNQAVEEARPLIENRGHKLTVKMPQQPIHLNADASRLIQVIGNLLNNAAKYTEPGGTIGLEMRREADAAVISVKDNGLGIAADLLPRVFDLFTQSDRTLDRSQGGLGIGLTLVRRLIEMHGGEARAFSPGPGGGSEFVVRLPVLPEKPKVEFIRSAATDHNPISTSSQRILIVDDNVDSADSLGMLLELSGHQVKVEYDGNSAIAAAGSYRPSLILLDIGLPGMNGYEVARRLRENPDFSGMMIVALTGYGQEHDRRKSQETGFNYHLIKPVRLEELKEIIARVDK